MVEFHLDWEDSFIINIYKGKGDSLERGNYRGLKLLDHVMKGIERVIEKIIRERISIDDMQFGFMPGRGTIDAIFILRQLLYFAFVDIEKGVRSRIKKSHLVGYAKTWHRGMDCAIRAELRVNNTYSDAFGVKVGVSQGSVLSTLLFVIVDKALSPMSSTLGHLKKGSK